jgi:hypothetical protein
MSGPEDAWIVRFGEAKVKKEISLVPQRKRNFNILSHSPHPRKRQSIHHVCHALHHKLTTKTPHAALAFSQKPLQKPHSTTPRKTHHKFERNDRWPGKLRPDQREDHRSASAKTRYTRHEVAAPRAVGPSGRTGLSPQCLATISITSLRSASELAGRA